MRRRKRETTSEELSLFGPEHWVTSIETDGDVEADNASTSPYTVASTAPVVSTAVGTLLDDMTWAVRYVDLTDIDTVRMIAMETSMIVQSSHLRPDSLYLLNTLSGERISGQRLSTLCYASFMRAFPGMIDHLDLNYYDIYQAALIR